MKLRERSKPEPSKKKTSAFFLFLKEKAEALRADHSDLKNTEISKILSEVWKGMSDEEKKAY